jgi:hypothetical protein
MENANPFLSLYFRKIEWSKGSPIRTQLKFTFFPKDLRHYIWTPTPKIRKQIGSVETYSLPHL